MFINSSPAPLPVLQATPEPRVAATQPVKAPTFANLLRQNRPPPAQAPVKPAAATPTPTTNNEAAPEPTEADDGAPATSAPGAQRTRAASADKAQRPATKAPAKAEAHDSEAATTEPDTRSADTPALAGEHPLLAQWLSHLHRPVEVSAETLARGTATKDVAEGAAGKTDTQDAAALASPSKLPAAGPDRAEAGQSVLGASAESFAQRMDAAAIVASANAETATGRRHDGPEPIDASSATPAAATSFAGSVASATLRPAEPTAVTIATPVNAPDFSQVLGVQLSVLARDGIQHAELQLNPADMGPVSVQIEMNGSQAHIDFGADVAATRQAIEAGLPELASALRDAGFTLSGGGVSQHARGGSEPGGDESRRSGRGAKAIGAVADGAAAASGTLRRNVTIGGLDLYA